MSSATAPKRKASGADDDETSGRARKSARATVGEEEEPPKPAGRGARQLRVKLTGANTCTTATAGMPFTLR